MPLIMSFTRKIRNDPSGQPILTEDGIAAGILWIVISAIPGFFGVLLLQGFLGMWLRGEPPPVSTAPKDLPVLICLILALVVLPVLGILRGVHVTRSSTSLVFMRARRGAILRKKRPGRTEEQTINYEDLRIEVKPVVVRNPKGPDWMGYEAAILHPSGRIVVRRSAALNRIEEYTEALCRRTGLPSPSLDHVRPDASAEVQAGRRAARRRVPWS